MICYKVEAAHLRRQTRTIAQRLVAMTGATAVALLLAGCGRGENFSLLGSSTTFQQSAATVNNKIDIVWVVDNPGSMDPLQTNLVNNFQSFMTTFQTKRFDYQISVTTTDAYKAAIHFANDPTLAKFRDGVSPNLTGVFDIFSLAFATRVMPRR